MRGREENEEGQAGHTYVEKMIPPCHITDSVSSSSLLDSDPHQG